MDFEPQIIRIVDFVDSDGMIRNCEFKDCLVEGPAMLMFCGEACGLLDCSLGAYEGDLDAVFLVVPEGPRNGFIGLEGVTFRNCSFLNVGIGGTDEQIDEFRTALLRRGGEGGSGLDER